MARRATALLATALLASSSSSSGSGSVSMAVSAADTCSNSLSVSYPAPVTAEGWSYRLVANGFTKPRGIIFDSDGGLIVVDSGVGLVHLTLKDEGGTCVSVAENKTLVESEEVRFPAPSSQLPVPLTPTTPWILC